MSDLPIHLNTVPQGFRETKYTHTWPIKIEASRMWKWLNSISTFQEGQVGPYTVEFIDEESPREPRFAKGVQTNHYGPFLNVAGVIGDIKNEEYRDLQYYYGSYVFFFSWVRPTRLQFFYDKSKKELKMELDAFVKPWFSGVWNWGMKTFWPSFGRWMSKEA